MSDKVLLPVGDTISGAWQKVSGTKGSVWGAILVMVLIVLLCGLFQFLANTISPNAGKVVNLVIQIIVFLLEMGLVYIGIQRALDRPVDYRLMFRTFDFAIAIRAIGLYILQSLILLVPAVIMIAGGILFYTTQEADRTPAIIGLSGLLFIIGFIVTIYLYVRMWLAMAFVLDQGTGPWDAIKKSFCATKSNIWNLIGISIFMSLIIIVSAIPLGIGLIWTIPLGVIVYGEVYRRLLANVTA